MLIECEGKYNDIVNVYQYKNPQERGQDVLHNPLKNSQSVAVAERHTTKLPKSLVHSKR